MGAGTTHGDSKKKMKQVEPNILIDLIIATTKTNLLMCHILASSNSIIMFFMRHFRSTAISSKLLGYCENLSMIKPMCEELSTGF